MTDQQTLAYQRALPRTWQQRVEDVITRICDIYDTALDLMPAIAALATLLWLINTASSGHP